MMGAWTLSEMFRMVLQSNELDPMQRHVEELEKYLGGYGYDRTVMSGSRGGGIDILLNRLIAVNSVSIDMSDSYEHVRY